MFKHDKKIQFNLSLVNLFLNLIKYITFECYFEGKKVFLTKNDLLNVKREYMMHI